MLTCRYCTLAFSNIGVMVTGAGALAEKINQLNISYKEEEQVTHELMLLLRVSLLCVCCSPSLFTTLCSPLGLYRALFWTCDSTSPEIIFHIYMSGFHLEGGGAGRKLPPQVSQLPQIP